MRHMGDVANMCIGCHGDGLFRRQGARRFARLARPAANLTPAKAA
jgi:hypothetical protein